MLTIKDIAKEAGVSQATVSRVINNTKPVSEKTRRHVQRVIDLHHYQPNVHAASLGKNNQIPIGVAYFSDIDESFAMLSNIEQVAKKYNVPTQIRSSDMNATSELNTIRTLLSYGCKIIMVHALYCDDKTLAQLAERHPELYFIDRRVPKFEHRCAWFEHEKAGMLLVKTAVRKDPSKCWCIFRNNPDNNTSQRERGIIRALTNETRLKRPYKVLRTQVSPEHGEDVLRDILSLGAKPECIIVDAPLTAMGVVAAYSDCGPEYSERISIVSFGGSRMINMYSSKIIRVNYPLSHMAEKLLIEAVVNQCHGSNPFGICLHPTLDRVPSTRSFSKQIRAV